MRIYKTKDILNKLDTCIKYKTPFSHIRFGDGGLKFIDSILNRNPDQLALILRKEGIPLHKIKEVLYFWGYYARHADFIDTPEVYFNETFWPRLRTHEKDVTEQTKEKLMNWKKLYYSAEFDNNNYCNPESNYLSIIRLGIGKNLIDIIKKRKVCIITTFPEVKCRFPGYCIDTFQIVGQYQSHYIKCFSKVVEFIKNCSVKYDLFLVAAGELGRIYSGLIKEYGGRSFDIGFVIEFWLGQDIHPRLMPFLERSLENPLELWLTKKGKKYVDSI